MWSQHIGFCWTEDPPDLIIIVGFQEAGNDNCSLARGHPGGESVKLQMVCHEAQLLVSGWQTECWRIKIGAIVEPRSINDR